MSQNDYVIANQTTPLFRADLNLALQALASNSSGSSAPSITYANMMWYDTTTNILKMRSEADDAWISIGTLDQSLNTFSPAGVDFAAGLEDFALGETGQPRIYGLAIDAVSVKTVSAADTYIVSEGISPVQGDLSATSSDGVIVAYTYTNSRFSGSMRFKCSQGASGGTSTLWLYKNGAIAAGPWTHTTLTYLVRTADVSIAVSDVIEWRHRNTSGTSFLKDFSVTANDRLVPILPSRLESEG